MSYIENDLYDLFSFDSVEIAELAEGDPEFWEEHAQVMPQPLEDINEWYADWQESR